MLPISEFDNYFVGQKCRYPLGLDRGFRISTCHLSYCNQLPRHRSSWNCHETHDNHQQVTSFIAGIRAHGPFPHVCLLSRDSFRARSTYTTQFKSANFYWLASFFLLQWKNPYKLRWASKKRCVFHASSLLGHFLQIVVPFKKATTPSHWCNEWHSESCLSLIQYCT